MEERLDLVQKLVQSHVNVLCSTDLDTEFSELVDRAMTSIKEDSGAIHNYVITPKRDSLMYPDYNEEVLVSFKICQSDKDVTHMTLTDERPEY